MTLHLDIETRSEVDLLKVGVYAYAEHPSTEITMVAFAFGQGEPYIWFPAFGSRQGDPIPPRLLAALLDPTVLVCAHNAGFERLLTGGAPGARIGIPRLPRERWDCTAARAARMGLPRSLDTASAALGLGAEKDAEGHKLMKTMMKPRKPTKKNPAVWIEDDATLLRVGAYCVQDVRVEQAINAKLPPLSEDERNAWLLTEEMNDRGVAVDTDLLTAVLMLVDEAEAEIIDAVRVKTGCICLDAKKPRADCGAVHGLHHSYITKWLVGLGFDDLAEDGVSKASVAAMLERDIDPLVRQILIMRQEGGGTASSKFMAILKRMSSDSRVRGELVYCGAASTGRWSSRGVQLQNLKRMQLLAKTGPMLAAIRDVLAGQPAALVGEIHGPPIVIAGELLRPTLVAADGYWLARGDSKQIEARVLPWLAGAEWKLNAFRAFDAGTGPDLYRVAAAGIYGLTPEEIDDLMRQIGKVSELALGFQGGDNALQVMARGYGIKIPVCPVLDRDEAPPDGCDAWIKRKWRAKNPEVADREDGLWSDLERTAIRCMQGKVGVWHQCAGGMLAFGRNAEVLCLRLPSGRRLVYWSPRLVMRKTPWGTEQIGVTYRAEDAVTRQWRVFDSYGGLWTENAVQAVARDLMAFWLRGMSAEPGVFPLLTVHDEGVCEVDKRPYPTSESAALAIEKIMRTKPDWAGALPVSADSSAGPRYVK